VDSGGVDRGPRAVPAAHPEDQHLEDLIGTAVGEAPVAARSAAEDIRAAWEAMPLCDRKQVVDRLMTVRILPAGKGKRCTREQVGIQWREGGA
jgi:hypothetical protein